MSSPSEEQTRDFYERFSLAVGERDWLMMNARHEQLKLQLDSLLAGRRDLEILDIGSGAGIMTACLTRYGTVLGLDLSEAGLDLARQLVPSATFIQGTLDALPPGRTWDVITGLDVLEHIPRDQRPQFLRDVRAVLAPGGMVVFSTPFPDFTRWRRIHEADELQIVDEEVELETVLGEAREVGLQLLRYHAYDVWRGSPEYQMIVFATPRTSGGPPVLRTRELERRLRRRQFRGANRIRRLVLALRLVRHPRSWRRIPWLLFGKPPNVRS